MDSKTIMFDLRSGFGVALKFFVFPMLALMLIGGMIVGGITAYAMKSMPEPGSSQLNPEITNVTTDVYADELLVALGCMQKGAPTSCDYEGRRSILLDKVTGGVLVINGKPYPAVTKEAMVEAVKKSPLKDVAFGQLTTATRGKQLDEITYTTSAHAVTLTMGKSPSGDILVTDIKVIKSTKSASP